MMNFDYLFNQLPFKNVQRAREDLRQTMLQYKTLTPKIGELVHNNGSISQVITLEGTIPIVFNKVTYHIPVEIHVLQLYPEVCPQMFVRPTKDMVIKDRHRHVDLNGLVYHPYLHQWAQSHTICGLIQATSREFSLEPPVYSRPPASQQPAYQPRPAQVQNPPVVNVQPIIQQQQPQPNNNANFGWVDASSNASRVSASYQQPQHNSVSAIFLSGQQNQYQQQSQQQSGGINYNAQPTNVYGIQVQPVNQYPPSNQVYSNPIPQPPQPAPVPQVPVVDRQKLMQDVSEKLGDLIKSEYIRVRDDITKEMKEQQNVEKKKLSLNDTKKQLTEKQEQLIVAQGVITNKLDGLNAWIQQKEVEMSAQRVIDFESFLIPSDQLTTQLTNLLAEHQAIEDTLYHLERAFTHKENKSLDLTSYLGESRKLLRRQYTLFNHIRRIQGRCIMGR